MIKYIDADKLIAEIERLEQENCMNGGEHFCMRRAICLGKLRNIITPLRQEQPAIPFMAGLKGNLPAGTKTIWCESKATPEKLVLKNELTGEVVVEKTIPEHMRGADPEIACACTKLLSAGWTLIAPGFEDVCLEKEIKDKYSRDTSTLKTREQYAKLARHFYELGLNARKEDEK